MPDHRAPEKDRSTSRRTFLRRAGMLASAATVAGVSTSTGTSVAGEEPPKRAPAAPTARTELIYQARLTAARLERDRPPQPAIANGDEERYPRRWNTYSKGLPHNERGEVDTKAYATYLESIEKQDHALFERIPLGGYLKLANPQAAYTIDIVGPDAEKLPLRTPPALASAEMVAELAELYWHAQLRDIPFAEFESHPLVRDAASELSSLSGYRGPREDGKVTPALLFRGSTSGARRGFYLSQFLLRDIPMTPIRVPHKIRTAIKGLDYMTGVADWLSIQNGQIYGVNTFMDTPRYIINGRDLGEFVHRDYTYQAALDACVMLLRMSAPLDGAVPYQNSITQGGFVTYGAAGIFHHVATVANLALKAAWYYKWLIHRSARPEEVGGRLHFHLNGELPMPFHEELRLCSVWERTHAQHQSYLLPQAFPEGCPSHPSYPSGHAVFVGACVTILKAWFADSWVLPNNVVPAKDGTTLQRYSGPELTVGGELDKLAENVAIGRNFGGIHWRFDAMEGLRLGEAFAIGYLREAKAAGTEPFIGFSLTTFDGLRVAI